MAEQLPTWEVIKAFAEGSYIEGDTFRNAAGEVIGYNGETLTGAATLNPLDVWEYVPYEEPLR